MIAIFSIVLLVLIISIFWSIRYIRLFGKIEKAADKIIDAEKIVVQTHKQEDEKSS